MLADKSGKRSRIDIAAAGMEPRRKRIGFLENVVGNGNSHFHTDGITLRGADASRSGQPRSPARSSEVGAHVLDRSANHSPAPGTPRHRGLPPAIRVSSGDQPSGRQFAQR